VWTPDLEVENMDSREYSGRTVDEAIEIALDKLGLAREEIKVTVLKEGKSGVFGIGAEEAKILVEAEERPEPGNIADSNASEITFGILEKILGLMEFNATVEPEEALTLDDTENAPTITFNITGDDDIGILIGRHGQTISSLQYLLRVMVAKKLKSPPPIVVDIDGYKKRRYEALRATAKRLAEQVKTRKTPFTLEPMPAFERRIIHLTLADDPNVTTQSIGEGEARKVVIMPKSMGRPRPINNR
jgi:spoIIIJ-associated protein